MNRALQTVCTHLFTRPSGILSTPGVNFIPCAWIRHYKFTDQQMRLRYKKLHWHKFYDDKWVQRRGGGLVYLFKIISIIIYFSDGMKKSHQKMSHLCKKLFMTPTLIKKVL
jgi:hypothetical protein